MKKLLINCDLRKLAIVAVALGATIGCGPVLHDSEGGQRSAPTTQKEAGFIVSGAKAQDVASFVENNPGSEFREINKAHQIYEVFTSDESALSRQLPNSEISKNQVFHPLEFQPTNLDQKIHQVLIDSTPDPKPETPTGDEKPQDNTVANCIEHPQAPQALVTSISHPNIAQRPVLLGETVAISSNQSSNHVLFPGKLKKAWVVIPPKDSLMSPYTDQKKVLFVTPDNMGAYVIGLVVQDARGVCNTKRVVFVVSSNKEMKSALETSNDAADAPFVDSADSLEGFIHLDPLRAEKSWELSTGQGKTIAIIDTGVHYNHPELQNNIWLNAAEIPNNGIDDDNNGFVDDQFGYDFTNRDPYPYDDSGHGTHVAGLAAASSFGMAKDSKIMALKALSPTGGDVASVVGALYYAADNGADVINLSLGSYGPAHPILRRAMRYLMQKGILVVAAAGNGSPKTGAPVDVDAIQISPSGLSYPNILSVAAENLDHQLAIYSNFGKTRVDLAAPGGDLGTGQQLLSTYYENAKGKAFTTMMGTSMATPIVSGIAAQVMASNPLLSANGVKHILMTSGPKIAAYKDKTVSERSVDAYSALNYAHFNQYTQAGLSNK